MATLIRLRDSVAIPLTSSSMVGRSSTCWVALHEPFASSEHAQLSFNEEGWALKDLGSKNGTFVDGRTIEAGKPVLLVPGARIGFGDATPTFELRDVEPPGPIAQNLESGAIITGDGRVVALPGDDRPEAVLYQGLGGWVVEADSGRVATVENRQVVRVGVDLFRLFLPDAVTATPVLDLEFTLRNADLRFAVGEGVDHVELEVRFRGREIVRLESGGYGRVLLDLARARLADRSVSPEQRGWRSVDELCDRNSVDPIGLNVAIYRARKRLASTKLLGALNVVEVKRGMRRLGTDRIEIVGSSLP
jgi:hypothetical protein